MSTTAVQPFGAGPTQTFGPPTAQPVAPLKPEAKKPAVAPTKAPLTPVSDGPPQPALQAVGFNGGIKSFNQRLEAFTHAHTTVKGYQPSPGMALDFATSSIPPTEFHPILSGPQSHRQLQAQQAIQATGGAPGFYSTPQELLAGAKAATAAGTWTEFAHQHQGDLTELAKDPTWAAKLAGAVAPAPRTIINQQAKTALAADAGGIGIVGLAFKQVAEGLVHAPGGVYQVATGISKDIDAAATGDVSFKRSRAIAEGMASAVKRDFTHPWENPGFLVMDVFGFASLGAGGVSRVAAAGRVEGLGAKATALATRPRGGTVEIGRPGATENAIVSDNPLVASAQKWNLNRRQKALDDATINGERIPAGIAGKLDQSTLGKWVDQHFSFASKIGREMDARTRIEHTQAMTIARELEHVVGGSAVVSRTYARMPAAIKNGLDRGENKAIQTVSFGVTPEDQIAFHRQMIDSSGDDPAFKDFRANHARQIADLELAKKVLANPNPSKRFRAALDLTRQVQAESERIRIDDLGLSPVTAEERVGKPGEVITGEKGTAQDYPATGPVEPFYTKTEPRGKRKRLPSDRQGRFAPKAGPFGEGPPRPLAELTHEMTGKAIGSGDARIDASHLTTEAYAKTVRAKAVLDEHDRHWAAGTELPKSRFDMVVRDKAVIPDKLRSALNAIEDNSITSEEAKNLPPDVRAVIDELYISTEEFEKKYGPLDGVTEPIDGVRFYDTRMTGTANDIPKQPGLGLQAVSALNEPLRDATLFLRPSYILNALGNTAQLVFHQGFAAVPSVAKALHAKAGGLDPETYRSIKTLVGQGRSKSYTSGVAPKVGQKIAQAWSVVTDESFRVASFIYEAKRLGYDMDALPGFVKTGGKELVEVTRRANKAMVEFDNLTPFEKNTLRHIIFVYPWVSRSTVWSLRAVMEHPAKVDFLAQLGREEADSDPLFKNVPAWFKATGYFAVGRNADGSPKVVNPTSINTFSTLGDITNLLSAGVGGDKGAALYTDVGSLFGPAGQVLQHGVTGTDEFGNRYPDRQWIRAAESALTSLPQFAAYERAGNAKGQPLKPFNVTDRASLEARARSAMQQTIFGPGWLHGYGTLIAGGLSGRSENQNAAFARWLKDQPADTRHKVEVGFLNTALGLQGDFLRTKVPTEVRAAVTAGADLTFQESQFAKLHGRPMTSREKTDAAIEYLGAKGSITPAQDKVLRATIPATNELLDPNAPNSGQIDVFLSKVVLGKYGGGDALTQWDADVRNLYSFRKQVFTAKAVGLKADGLYGGGSASQPALFEYGRRYLTYSKQLAELKQRVTDGKATTADLRVFQDEHSKPQGSLPSFAAMDWANTSPDAQASQLRSASVAGWDSLSGFEKQLLGHKVAPTVTAGWKDYAESIAAYREQNPGTSLAPNQLEYLVNEEDKTHPGFAKDWLFSQKPKIDRFQTTTVYKRMPPAAKKAWDTEIAASARTVYAALQSGNYKAADLRQAWRNYIDQDVPAYLDAHPELKQYLAGFNRDFLKTLEEK